MLKLKKGCVPPSDSFKDGVQTIYWGILVLAMAVLLGSVACGDPQTIMAEKDVMKAACTKEVYEYR